MENIMKPSKGKTDQDKHVGNLGNWYSWDSPVGLGLAAMASAASLYIVAKAIEIVTRFW